MRLQLPHGTSQRATRTIGRHTISFRCKNAVPAGVRDGVVAAKIPPPAASNTQRSSKSMAAGYTRSMNTAETRLERKTGGLVGQENAQDHRCCCSCGGGADADRSLERDSDRPHALLSRATVPLCAIDSPDSTAPLLNYGEGNLGQDESASETLCEDEGCGKGVDVCADLRLQKVPAVEKADDVGGERSRDGVPSLLAKEGHHPLQDVDDDDREVPSLDLGGRGAVKIKDGRPTLPPPNEEQCSPPLSSRVYNEEFDPSRDDPSGATAISPSGTAAILPDVHAVRKSDLLGEEVPSTSGIPPHSAGERVEERPCAGEERIDFKAMLCTGGPRLSLSSPDQGRSDGIAPAHEDGAMEPLREQRGNIEAVDEESSQPCDGDTAISTTASVIFSDDHNLSEDDASGTSSSIGKFDVETEVEDSEPRREEVAAPAAVNAYVSERKDTPIKLATGDLLLVPCERGTTVDVLAGGGNPVTRCTPSLQPQSYSPTTSPTDGGSEGEYEFTFDEDETAVSGRKSVQFSDESLWRVHEVRASFEKHELAELFYTSAELDAMVEEAEREEDLERSKGRVLREERGHPSGHPRPHDGSKGLLFGSYDMEKQGADVLSCDRDSDYDF